MVEPAHDAARGALSRVLAREARWLERAPDEPLAAVRARHGLDWLGTLAADFGAPDAAAWFHALRDRPAGDEAAASHAWRELGAPCCAHLATLAALRDDSIDWPAEQARLLEFVEPAPAPESAPPPPLPPAIEPAPAPPLFLAIAAFAGDVEPTLSISPGRVEIAGVRTDDPEALAMLDEVARAAGAVIDTQALPDGAIAWRVIVRAEGPAEHVFVGLAGADDAPAFAVALHRALGPGLAPGAVVPALTFGHGLRRARLDAARGDAPLPAGIAVVGEVPGPHGRVAFAVEVVDDAATAGWVDAAPAPPQPPAAAPAPAPEPEPAPEPPVEALQAPAFPADAMVEAPVTEGGHVLVADDSLMARVFLARLLAQEGFVVEGVENGEDARVALSRGEFALVFLDFDLPGGSDLLEVLAPERRPRVCALVKDEDERSRALALGLGPALLKPFDEDEVRAALEVLRGPHPTNP